MATDSGFCGIQKHRLMGRILLAVGLALPLSQCSPLMELNYFSIKDKPPCVCPTRVRKLSVSN